MIFSNIKKLDLHGENRELARILVEEFIDDCYQLGETEAVIIHGIGSGILKKEVQKTLSKNKKVENFYIDFFNIGQTIVKIKPNI